MAQCHIQWLYLAVHGCKTYLNLNLNLGCALNYHTELACARGGGVTVPPAAAAAAAADAVILLRRYCILPMLLLHTLAACSAPCGGGSYCILLALPLSEFRCVIAVPPRK
jgi:hypothetical protein